LWPHRLCHQALGNGSAADVQRDPRASTKCFRLATIRSTLYKSLPDFQCRPPLRPAMKTFFTIFLAILAAAAVISAGLAAKSRLDKWNKA
jgi:hypothetical protein